MTNSEDAILRLFEERAIKSESGTTRDASDGRVANRLRNRNKVIDTYIELVNEGKTGSLDQIVERSGVAKRSVFRYFNDLSDLAMEGFRRVVADAATGAFYSDPGKGPLETRIRNVVDVRLRTMELTHPFGLMARRRLSHIADVRDGLIVVVEITRAQLAEQFAPELATVDADVADRTLDSLSLIISFESYDFFIRQLGRSAEATAATWTDMITAVIQPA